MDFLANIVCLLMAVSPGVFITSAQQDHDLRLTEVLGNRGRVEIFNNGVWGSICREGWDYYDALVTCKQLGFAWLRYSGWLYNPGSVTDTVWLSNVGCTGSETSLAQCSNDGWMEHECPGENNAAGVSCLTYDELGPEENPLDTAKLLKYTIAAQGSVGFELQTTEELGIDETFLISDKGWDMADAEVICRQVGYHSAARATSRSYFGKWQSDPIKYLASEFACHGNESTLLQCPAKDWFPVDPPSEWRQAGVICNRIKEPEGFQIRLVNGTTADEGRLEVFYDGAWGSVCRKKEQRLSYLETTVICGQLGLGYGKEEPIAGRYGRSSLPVAMSGGIQCFGSERSLAQCRLTPGPCAEILGSFDASVNCSGPIPESRSPIRFYLFDSFGVVMIYHDGSWGSICNAGWTMANAQVVCRELGYGPPEKALEDRTGLPFGPIFLGGVTCQGDEATLDQCDLGEWSQQEANCDHSMDVAVTCTPHDEISAGRQISAENTLIVTILTALYCMLQTYY